jgi:SAM-dependent methyltransferase
MNVKNSKNSIKQAYSSIARKKTINSLFPCCGQNDVTHDVAINIGYTEQELNSAPKESNQGLGCGNPVAEAAIKKGDTILDLGSGAGFDAFLASSLVGDSGKVIGVDFSEDMINKATATAATNGYKNIDFRLGDIENLPVESNSVNVIMSNCVINLNQNKQQVFNEAYRVMAEEAKLIVSDILLLEDLPDVIKNSFPSHIACVAGAVKKTEYISMMQNSGFKDIQILSEQSFPLELILSDPTLNSILKENYVSKELMEQAVSSVVSVKFSATK